LTAALSVLERRLGAKRSIVYAVNAEQRSLTVAATHGLRPETLRARFGTGAAGRVAASAKPLVVPALRYETMALSDFSDAEEWRHEAWSLVAVPIRAQQRGAGVLCAYFDEQDPSGFAARLNVLEVAAASMADAMQERREPSTPHASPSVSPFEYANMIGESAVMRQIYEQVGQVARTSATALLRGESGTGKELVARAIHQNSARAGQPFVKVNCAALPEALFESELFGHERGAFTGAMSRKKGRFEVAEGGTLFLDEIGELPLLTQAKLLRALQFREFERLGGTETLRADVRIVAATHVNIEQAVAAGRFRDDLYYRINIFTITLPPLRERASDIPGLAEYFLHKYATEHQRKITRISSTAVDCLCRQPFPGNVRELENAIERAVVACKGAVIQVSDLPPEMQATPGSSSKLTLSEAVDRLERRMIEEALAASAGSAAAAARELGTSERVVRYKMRKLGIAVPRRRE
jgi:Nif-specific regulatory protein